jgi:predicted nucleic acid-binding protein
MRTVSNTSPISNLAIIGQLDLLHEQFGQILIPGAVCAECEQLANPPARNAIQQAIDAGWLLVTPVANVELVKSLLSHLHEGESEAIALAMEMKADLVLIDEREGRRIARESGLTVRGILGVLLRAKKTGRLETVKPSIDLLKSQARFFIAPELEQQILAEAGENQKPA